LNRLQWDVHARGDLERDCYDLLGPIYGLCLDPHRKVVGCWRLLPTTGPYMLRDLFPTLIGAHEMPASHRVWEISRFAVSDAGKEIGSSNSLQTVTGLLLCGLLECALNFSIQRIVAVTDLRFEKILKRAGMQTSRFCQPRPIGSVMSTAGWVDVSEDVLRNIRRVFSAADAFRHPRAA